MSKTVLIHQPCGLGDIFFLQKIVHLNIQRGHKVIYPVNDNLLFVKDYIQKDGLEFVSVNSDFGYNHLFSRTEYYEDDDVIYYPCWIADRFIPGCVMRAKYKMFDIDWTDWANYFTYQRNYEKEDKLYYDVLGLDDHIEYNFLNKTFGSYPHVDTKKEVHVKNNLPTVEMTLIEGYNIFDWLKVIINAKNFYSVDTAILFLMEKQKLKCEENDIELWSRHWDNRYEDNYKDIDGLFTKKYKYN